jgi:transposase-like protein
MTPDVTRPRAKIGICQVCAWKGVLTSHRSNECARYLWVKKLCMAGMSRREIKRELGVSDNTLNNARDRLGLEIHGPKVETCRICGWRGWSFNFKSGVHPCARNLQLKRMYRAGMPLTAMGRVLGMDPSLVLRALRSLGVKRRPSIDGNVRNPLGLNGRMRPKF